MSASNLADKAIAATLNSSEGSRKMDAVHRLSLCSKNPMMFVAEKRITDPVMLEIKLEVVSRPNVIFYDSNATRSGAKQSTKLIRFDVVKAKSHFDVPAQLRHFYQAEVLVPSPVPPHLIVAAKSVKLSWKKTPNPIDETPANMLPAVKTIVNTHEKKNDHTPLAVRKSRTIDEIDTRKLSCSEDACDRHVYELVTDDPPYRIGCRMPTSEANMKCDFCKEMSTYINCPDHMGKCGNDMFLCCNDCGRYLCGKHMHACYCSIKFAAALQENNKSSGGGPDAHKITPDPAS